MSQSGFDDFLGTLSRMGRGAGVFAIVLGGPLLYFGVWAVTPGHLSDPHNARYLLGAGGLLVAYGVWNLVTGGGAALKPMERAALLERLPTTPQPFSICSNCFLLYPKGRLTCRRCGEDCLTVSGTRELEVAQKALTL